MENNKGDPLGDVADWIDYNTWMICPYCDKESVRLVRKKDGRYCPKCDRFILTLCKMIKK